jgi:uncharacterized protein YndB with AHSA1/START domain
MLKKIGLVIVAAVVVILIWAATKPSTFHFERTATIKAPPAKIMASLTDFHRWPEWSPYEKLDPAMKRTHSGAAQGKGAVYTWQGNSQAGAGRMEIVDATPTRVRIQLDFTKPFAASDVAEFTLAPHGDTTTVTWSMDGPNQYLGKVMSIFINMDKMVGDQFATGLASLKRVAEKT